MRSRLRSTYMLLALLAAASAGLSACDDDEATDSAAATGADENRRFVYISGVQNDPAYDAIGCGVKLKGRDIGVSVEQQDPRDFTPATQTPVVNAVAASDPDGIIISPNDATALYAPLQQVQASGIPVVSALNTLDDPTPLVAEMLADEIAGGRTAAEFMAEAAGDRKGKVAMITFRPGGSVPTDLRREGFEAAIKEHPNLEYVGAEFMQSIDPQEATSKMNAIFAREGELIGVVANFGLAGDGVAASIRQRGADVIHVTFDVTSPATVQSMRQGLVSAIIDYDQRGIGGSGLEAALAAAEGETVAEKKTVFPPLTFTTENIDDPELAAFSEPECPL